MKVHISYTTDASDDYRRALCHTWGEHGRLASRDEVKRHMELVGSANDDDLMYEYENCDEGCREEPHDA
jgi:hypothetical protein